MFSSRLSGHAVARVYQGIGPSTPGSILCFHSLADGPLDAGSPHVSAATLRMAVDAARAAGEIVPLRELLARHAAGRSTHGLSALTFDDAYAALLSPDATFLQREHIPFTVFVTTNASREGRVFWWDRVDELFPRTSFERWRSLERACGVPDSFRDGQPVDFGPLRPLRQWMLHAYRGRTPSHVNDALTELERELGVRTAQRAMTFQELESLARHPTVDVGVHTCSHPVLPLLADDELAAEITFCHQSLRERFQRVVPVLAVPFGLFDSRSTRIARAAGMSASLTLASRTLQRSRGEDWLPRFCVCAGETPVKLLLRLSGVMERWHSWRDGPPPPYPALPSATS